MLRSLQPLQALLNDLHVMLLLLTGQHMEDLIAKLEPIHHSLGRNG